MKSLGSASMLVAGVLSALATFTASGATPPGRESGAVVQGDVAALAIYRAMHAAIREARALSYESEYVRETGGKEIGRSSYRLLLRKPNYARLESRSEDGTKTGVLILDGRRMWIYWPDGRPYIHESDSAANTRDVRGSYLRKDARKGGHSIARETSVLGTGMSMTIIDPSIFLGSPDLMDALLESVKSDGSVNVDGEVCDIIEASYLKGQRTRVFWISRRDRLPRRLEETMRGKRDIVVRERWRDVVVNGTISKDQFRWKPPAGWEEYPLQSLDDGLLRPGSEAPDFELALLDGSRFRLSEHRGKVVWLSFWRLSCIPCRKELPHLQMLQDRYAGEGLVVLGFNCADGREQAEGFIREKMIRFPNVVDSTTAAREVFHERYQTAKGQSALPLNYIIDIRGRIVGGWYGYEKGSDRGERILRSLGMTR
ncbi:MAG: TlpA disulfide reductase family protein [Candidatus Krumholzibacteria bacterium]|nr:TlpA disulfide reductase family protein [Candidatus Krumholzibacteria bacterium]